MSKGDSRRPAAVDEKEVSRRWQQAFGQISSGKPARRSRPKPEVVEPENNCDARAKADYLMGPGGSDY